MGTKLLYAISLYYPRYTRISESLQMPVWHTIWQNLFVVLIYPRTYPFIIHTKEIGISGTQPVNPQAKRSTKTTTTIIITI